jgi:hypothetical protein
LDKARHTQPRSQLEPGNEGRRMLPWGQVADRERFELSIPFQVYTRSRRAP